MSGKAPSTRLSTAEAILAAYNSLSTSALEPLLDSSFTKEILPKSLGEPTSDRESYLKQSEAFPLMFSSSIITPREIFEDDTRNAVVVYGGMKAEFVGGKGVIENEFVMVMFMSEDGKKVVKMLDFRGK
ncbi:uncharacterized protein LY89DRAFT_173855 [Mollisia scopiformis]|uniref:NTF2-like protein n=1 Tax=Mollisia scopiformis TaxID=149040 RepID=A0A194XSE1_MOLSC|nr:uncharacterized protein LY89DRAFT_173855 [Mollisia scopiformis]KUJ23220.1 hypothetical protein LY89DRAFT_173855 [Mollisia scopiformis]